MEQVSCSNTLHLSGHPPQLFLVQNGGKFNPECTEWGLALGMETARVVVVRFSLELSGTKVYEP